jgi:hypothetical protein
MDPEAPYITQPKSLSIKKLELQTHAGACAHARLRGKVKGTPRLRFNFREPMPWRNGLLVRDTCARLQVGRIDGISFGERARSRSSPEQTLQRDLDRGRWNKVLGEGKRSRNTAIARVISM